MTVVCERDARARAPKSYKLRTLSVAQRARHKPHRRRLDFRNSPRFRALAHTGRYPYITLGRCGARDMRRPLNEVENVDLLWPPPVGGFGTFRMSGGLSRTGRLHYGER